MNTKLDAAAIDRYFAQDRLACLECGRCFDALGVHLRYEHGMSADDYKARHGLPWGRGLLSSRTRGRQSDAAKLRIRLGVAGETFLDPYGDAAIAGRLVAGAKRRRAKPPGVAAADQRARLVGRARACEDRRARLVPDGGRWVIALLGAPEAAGVLGCSVQMARQEAPPGSLSCGTRPIRCRWKAHACRSLSAAGWSRPEISAAIHMTERQVKRALARASR